MKRISIKTLLLAPLTVGVLLCGDGCGQVADVTDDSDLVQVVATTTMLYDLACVLGGDALEVTGLLGAGVDPHLYQASAGDVILMDNADIILYNGLHLEAAMGEVLDAMQTQSKQVICAADGIDPDDLIVTDASAGSYDPHIWFDVSLWMDVTTFVASALGVADPEHADYYLDNASAYLDELQQLDDYIHTRVAELPDASRVLITAHDAFGYFGKAYGFEVLGIQGISTETEASTAQISTLASVIADEQIKAIFVESSVSSRTIEALQAAVSALGFDVDIGGELYSDSLGDASTGQDSYLAMVTANVDTIVDNLS